MRRASRAGRGMRDDAGSALAEHTMTMALVVFVFLAVCQFAYAAHVRSTLTMAAAEGARSGARVGANSSQAHDRAAEIAASSLSSRYAHDIRAYRSTQDGVAVMQVDVTAAVPVLGPFGVGLNLHTSARAVLEERDAS